SRNTSRAKSLRNQATPAEQRLWSVLRGSGLAGFKFSRQMPVGPYFVDFLCRSARLVVELDGISHDGRLGMDARRDAYLEQNGYHVVRFSNEQVFDNLEGVIAAIEAVLIGLPTPCPSRKREGSEAQ
ncbi:MAG: DUF559 domain-containing protein, partial [Sphingomonadaceae bacterium]|nr:DUF559 domain-containing protein [Sphingomonadaceae bacterium]